MADACEADASFVCPACGGLVREARRAAHAEMWCPAAAGGNSGDIEDAEEGGKDSIALEVKALLSPQYVQEIPVQLSFLPGIHMKFEQRAKDEPGDAERHQDSFTGGHLWWSEMVLSEFLALRYSVGARGAAVALGCGAAPMSAYTAAVLGFEVLCTDLADVLPLTKQNAVSNSQALTLAREALRAQAEEEDKHGRGGSQRPAERQGEGEGEEEGEERSPLERLEFSPLPFGEEFPSKTRQWVDACGGVRLIVCSDCIWQAHRHRSLAATLAELLRTHPRSEALVAYQLRDGAERSFFPKLGHFNLRSEPLDVSAAVRRVRFPRHFEGHGDPTRHFCVHRVWRDAAQSEGAH